MYQGCIRIDIKIKSALERLVHTFFAYNYFDGKDWRKDSAARAYMYRLDNENNYFLDFGAKF